MSVPNIPRIYDHRTNRRLGFLQNAYAIGYHMRLNGLSTAQFTMPANDPKNIFCQPYNLVEIFDDTRRVELFRIMPTELKRNTRGDIIYNCEHVIATLIDNTLFKYHQIGNLGVYTANVIRYIIDRQNPKRWELGDCEFKHQFEYKWENDNLLAAIFSVPKPFIEDYAWEYDTTESTWLLHLRKIPEKTVPECEIRYKKNMTEIKKNTDPTKLITRLYALGYGEGDNQLTIESVNGGIPYIEDLEAIQEYGVKESIFVDRRFENAEALLGRAKAILKESKEIYTTYSASAADMFILTGQDYDFYKEGRLVRIVDNVDGITKDLPIIEVEKRDITGEPFQLNIVIGNAPQDVASSIAELADRARINELYSQGATNQFLVPFWDEADTSFPAVLPLEIPNEVAKINICKLTFRLEPFRATSKSVSAAEQQVKSTTAAAQQTQSTTTQAEQTPTTSSQDQLTPTTSTLDSNTESTSTLDSNTESTSTLDSQTESTSTLDEETESTEYDGFSSDTTDYDGDSVETSDDGDWIGEDTNLTSGEMAIGLPNHDSDVVAPHIHLFNPYHNHDVDIPRHRHSFEIPDHRHKFVIPAHSHDVTVPGHSHDVTVPGHDHTVSIPGHSHTVKIPAHSHTVTIAAHSHTVTIPEHDHSVTIPEHTHKMEFGIYEGETASKVIIHVDGKKIEENTSGIDITKYLSVDSSGKIRRNYEHKIEIYPDKMTRIYAYLFCQVYTNSRGGGDY